MLGEPEAVVAAVCAPGLTDELARRAWWAMEDADNARRMLGNPAVREGQMGRILAEYLIEYLPFEGEPERATESVRLCLQPGLLERERRLDLWKRSARKPAHQLGFLMALPDDLPDPEPARRDAAELGVLLRPLIAGGDPYAAALERVLSGPGQTFLKVFGAFLAKPPTQDLVVAAFDLTRDYFSALRPEGDPDLTVDALWTEAQTPLAGPCLALAPKLTAEVAAMRRLSGLGYGVLRGPLLDSTAAGGLMRRKLAPVLDRIQGEIDVLRGRAG